MPFFKCVTSLLNISAVGPMLPRNLSCSSNSKTGESHDAEAKGTQLRHIRHEVYFPLILKKMKGKALLSAYNGAGITRIISGQNYRDAFMDTGHRTPKLLSKIDITNCSDALLTPTFTRSS